MRDDDFEPLPRLSVRLQLGEGPFDPADITARVGLQPTHAHRLGDLVVAASGARARADTWAIRVGPRESLDLNELLNELRKALDSRWGRLVVECALGDLAPTVSCVIEPRSSQQPAINLPPSTLSWILEIGAALDVDLWA